MAASVQPQVCVIHTHTHAHGRHCCTEIVERVMMACLSPADENSSSAGQRNILGFTSFSIRDLLRSKEPHISLSLRPSDGTKKAGEVKVSRLQMEGENQEESPPHQHQYGAVCERLHSSVHDKENSQMMRAVLSSQVRKVYRFQTEDHRWLLVREQMAETPLSFWLPRQLLSTLSQELSNRVQEVKELGDLSPHWEGLRQDIISHCSHLIGCYQETLVELEKLSATSCFKSSTSKSERYLQFVATNLHSQRMEVSCPDSSDGCYEVITVGAPSDHHQAFKHGGLRRLLSKHAPLRDSSSYSQDERCRARELLASVAHLQPLLFGQAEELLSVSLELNAGRLQEALDQLGRQTERFVHALKDELVRSALLDIHTGHAHHSQGSHACSNGLFADPQANHDASTRLEAHYDEEEWDTAWANVAKSLNCIVAMVDRIKGRDEPAQEAGCDGGSATTSPSPSSCSAASWQEQLLPLVLTLRDCVREAVAKAHVAMTFVLLQGAAAATVNQGPAPLVRRRHAVLSQALSSVVCGFLLKLCGHLEDPDYLRQLHTVGVLVQFEGLLSTYGDEVGMLEDMEVGVTDLSRVTFAISEAKTEQLDDLLPTLHGAWGSLQVEIPLPGETFQALPQELKDGCAIPLHPVLFNIGINQQQSLAERFGDSSLQERINHQGCERMRCYCEALMERLPETAGVQGLPDLLASLSRNLEARKRKNVEVLWSAAQVCRQVNGVRLTSCKSAKDRTAMSVTLEQCVLLRDKHSLSQQHFATALDSMRRSRLSWGQMLGCYAQPGCLISGCEPSEQPLALVPCLAPEAPRRHLYPVGFLLVTSHLLVLWLILSLLILLSTKQEGCRMENVQKNVGNRKFAFSGVQLLTFPKLYRPPDGSYG